MKNVRKEQLKKCVFKELEEFKCDVLVALGNDVEVTCDYDGIYFERNNDALCTEEILVGISKYYDVDVTSIHVDDCDITGVWIVYK